MSDRRSMLPLLVGGVVALLLHAAALPLAALWLDRPVGPAQNQDGDSPDILPAVIAPNQQVEQPAPPSAPATPRQTAVTTPPPKPEQPKPPAPTPVPPPPVPARAEHPPTPPSAVAKAPPPPQRRASSAPKPRRADSKPLPVAKPGDIRPGMDDSPEPLSVTWISYKDYQKMIGPQGPVEQPAIQQEATPVPGAPLIPDPIESTRRGDPRAGGVGGLPQPAPPAPPIAAVPPVPPSVAQASPTPPQTPAPTPMATVSAETPKPPAAAPIEPHPPVAAVVPPVGANPILPLAPVPPSPPLANSSEKPADPSTTPPGPLAAAPVTDRAQGPMMALANHPFPSLSQLLPPTAETPPVVPDANSTTAPPLPLPLVNQVVTTTQPTHNSTLGDGRPATGLMGESGPRPSGAPRARGEVAPSSLLSADPVTIRAGAVWAGEGLQIHPVVPRTTIGMLYSVPNNPLVRLTFNRTGEVIAAKLIRTTGSDAWDGPILAASYRWTASGEKLALIGRQGTEQEFVWILSPGGED